VTAITRISIDTSKSVFTLHGVDTQGRALLRRNLRRRELVPFFTKLPPVEVAMEAWGGSHHWGRTLQALGHRVRLIPAQYVKPFVKRGKNDRNDAEAISEAANRPGIHDVAIKSKSVETQAKAMLLSVRDLLVRQRTQMANALRGHATCGARASDMTLFRLPSRMSRIPQGLHGGLHVFFHRFLLALCRLRVFQPKPRLGHLPQQERQFIGLLGIVLRARGPNAVASVEFYAQ
jgi:hypothetical protein